MYIRMHYNVYTHALQYIYPMYILMHYNVYTHVLQSMYIEMHYNVYTDTLQCMHPIYIVYIRWVTFVYTLCCISCHTMYIYFACNLLPNVYTFVTQCIFNIHWVYTFGYICIYIGLQDIYIVLHFMSHNVYRKICYPMYIRQNALQCISPMYIKCNTMYIPPYTFTDTTKRGVYTLGYMVYTFGCMSIYI